MKEEKKNSSKPGSHRKNAKGQIEKKDLIGTTLLPDDNSHRLPDKLLIHQVEMEMQNEEHRVARDQAETASEKFTSLYDFAPTGYFTLDTEGIIYGRNLSGSNMPGREYSGLDGSNFRLFVSQDTLHVFNDFMQKTYETKIKQNCEVKLDIKGSPSIFVHIDGIFSENDQRFFVSVVDITQRKLIEEKLRESETKFRNIYEDGPLGMALVGIDFKFIMTNNTFCRMLGYNKKEFNSLTFKDVTHPDYIATDHENINKLLQGKIPVYRTDKLYIRKDKQPVWGSLTVKAIHDQYGKMLYLIAIIEDISDRKQAEEELSKSASQWQTTFDAVKDAVCLLSFDQRILRMNKAMREIFPESGPELIGRPCWEVVHGTKEPWNECPVQKMEKSLQREVAELELSGRWFDITADPFFDTDNKLAGAVHIMRDITMRKQVLEELNSNYFLLRTAGKTAKFGGWSLNIDENKVIWSDEVAAIHEMPPGYSPSLNEGISFYAPEWHYKISSSVNNCIMEGIPFDEELQLITAKGRQIWVRATGEAVKNKIGKIYRIQGSFQDISEYKREEAINASRIHLIQFSLKHSIDELLEETLNETEKLTDSRISFVHFVKEDQVTIVLQSWSGRTKSEFCKAEGQGLHYPLSDAGVWTDCVYQRKPVIHNDYASLTHRKGLPEGHAEVIRELVVPVFRNEKITAILGVGNKPSNYNQQDIQTVSLLANLAWEIAERMKVEEALKESQLNYKIVADNTYDWEFWRAPDGKYLYQSPSCKRITGYSAEDFINDPELIFNIIHPEDRDAYELHRKTEQSDRKPATTELKIITADDAIRWIEHCCQSVFDADGKFMGTRGSNRDITERKQAELALLESEQIYHAMFENTQAIKLLINPDDGSIVDANSAAINFYGYTLQQLLTIRISDIDTLTTQQIKEEMEKAASEKRPYFNRRHRLANGAIRDVEAYSSPIKIGGFNLTYYIIHDVTLRKQAEEALRFAHDYNRNLIEASIDPLVTIGENGKITDVNFATEKVTGCSRNELIGTEFSDYFTEPDKARAGYQQVFSIGSVKDYPLEIIQRSGKIIPVLYNATVYHDKDGKVIGVFAAAHDITERIKAEEQIMKLNEELEKRVVERTINLQKANRELETFSYSASHQIRTPLRALNGFAHILFEDYSSSLDEEGKRLLKVIIDNANEMGQLIDDLLSVTGITRQEIKLSGINMYNMVNSVYDELLRDAEKDKIQFHLQNIPDAYGDPILLRQVWAHLIDNAIKFSSVKSNCIIEVGYRREGAEDIYYIKDNGAGFNMEHSNKIFGVFQRLHSKKDFAGTGIGLSIVQRIINRHNGRVWAEGKLDEGATFYFSLPHR